MNTTLETHFNSFLGQLLPFLLSFVDDALLLGFSHLGLHAHWLKWLSPVILSFTVLYWVVRLWHHQCWGKRLLVSGQKFKQKASAVKFYSTQLN